DQVTEPAHSGDIAARPVEAGYVALLDRVAACREHDWDRGGRGLSSPDRSAPSGRDNHGHVAFDQIGRKCRQSIVLVFRETILDHHVAACDVAGFIQAAAESLRESRRLKWSDWIVYSPATGGGPRAAYQN